MDNLKDVNVLQVYKKGNLVAQNYEPLFDSETILPKHMTESINVGEVTVEDLKIKIEGHRANVIKILADSIVTDHSVREVDTKDGYFEYGPNKIQKIVVLERHKKTDNIGVGLIEGYDIERGAVATTIAHDSHNIIVVGDNDNDILLAVEELKDIGGGITMASDGKILHSLPLEIGGIMSEKPIEYIRDNLEKMSKLAYDKLKISKEIDPFMTLSFMGLPVIPKLKLTDMGLFDVEKFDFINVSQ